MTPTQKTDILNAFSTAETALGEAHRRLSDACEFGLVDYVELHRCRIERTRELVEEMVTEE